MALHRQLTTPQTTPRPFPARRHLALHLPRWGTDCLRRADPAIGRLTVPFALYEVQHGAMRLVELDARASAAGLFATQSLADARALVPNLQVREIDRAFLAGLPRIRIVHGTGMGVLRRTLREYLRSHPHVTTITEPPQNEGGQGATVVELRQ